MPEAVGGAAADGTGIFFNCPFDDKYQPIFDALVFAAFDCGYVPRCALEVDDAGQVRLEKILAIIRDCRLGVHDISRTELDPINGLPRFNMPLELGIFIGAARFGTGEQKKKVCLVLDRERYRFQKFISDIAGQDIREHGDDPERAIHALRSWLAPQPRDGLLPGATAIASRYRAFRQDLPQILAEIGLEAGEMTFSDYANIVSAWLSERPRTSRPAPASSRGSRGVGRTRRAAKTQR
ncbi:MAG: hypothetical protein IRY87_03675 [Acetobacteraceae bacterium]|nr:hypothetical protein [Acetobacteraceae bacterium]